MKKHSKDCTFSKVALHDSYTQPVVKFNYEAIQKMEAYVDNSDKEIGWLGFVDVISPRHYLVTDVRLVEQKVSSTTAELNEKGLQKFIEELIDTNQTDKIEKVRCWGHSHVKMAVSPSSQDEDTFEEYYRECKFFIMLICNKDHEMRVDIVERDDEIRFHNVDWEIVYPDDLNEINTEISKWNKTITSLREKFNLKAKDKTEEINEKAKNEIKKYVTEEKVTYYSKNYTTENNLSNTWDKWNNKKKIKTKVPVYIGEEYEFDTEIDELYNDEDIKALALQCKSPSMLKELLGSEDEFKGYKYENWEELYDVIIEYAYEFQCKEEDEDDLEYYKNTYGMTPDEYEEYKYLNNYGGWY